MLFRVVLSIIVALLLGGAISAQLSAKLQTSDTQIELRAGPRSPLVESLTPTGQAAWKNRESEALVPYVEVAGRRLDCHWALDANNSHVDPRQVSFTYESESPHLRLSWTWSVRQDYGPIEHEIRIENLGDQEIWLPMQDSLGLNLQITPTESLVHVYVEKGANTPSAAGTHIDPMAEDYRWTGTSSTYGDLSEREPREIIPWTLVQRGDAVQSGWYVGIEFSGRTRISLERKKDALQAAFGLNPDPTPFQTRLAPGEAFETPVVFVGAFRNGVDGAGNVLRRWVRATLGNPLTWKQEDYPLVVNNSWGGGMAVDEAVAQRMIRDAADLGFEMFHVDAGWFRAVGDWRPDPKKFPRGLAVIADEAHRRNMKFGLWVDWAQAGLSTEPGALNVRDAKVRDWMVTDLPANWEPEPFKGQTIDIGVPEARQWVQGELERIVSDYHLDMLEHDGYLVAKGCDRTDHPHAAPDPLNQCIYRSSGFYFVDSSNSTDVSYHAVRAYYDIYSKLRKDHPGLLLEICNDGGRMVDFGSASHGDYFSITDTYDPLSNRRAFYDTSHVLPAAMLESYVEKWPTPRIENFRYMLRSGMMGWLSVMIDTNSWTAEQHAAAKREIELYKKQLRPLIREGDLYHVAPRPDGKGWDGIEYWDSRVGKGVIYAFRGSSEGETSHVFRLRGLAASSRYRLHLEDGSSPDGSMSGKELMSSGVKVSLPIRNSSELVFIQAEQ